MGSPGSDESYGAAGAFLIEAGISSSYHIANFFGLTERVSQPNEVVNHDTKIVAKPAPKPAAPVIPSAATAALQSPDLAATLWPRTAIGRPAVPPRTPKRNGIDVGAVITRALTAAGSDEDSRARPRRSGRGRLRDPVDRRHRDVAAVGDLPRSFPYSA